MGRSYERLQYLGHGQSKVCFWLTEKLLLKLRNEDDREPRPFRQLEATGVYPKVYAASTCECDGTRGIWHAWVVDRAKPLDKILKENPAASNVCIPGAVRAMLIAHFNNHILSDNALFNFGMVDGNVVIIDAGSRFNEPEESAAQHLALPLSSTA